MAHRWPSVEENRQRLLKNKTAFKGNKQLLDAVSTPGVWAFDPRQQYLDDAQHPIRQFFKDPVYDTYTKQYNTPLEFKGPDKARQFMRFLASPYFFHKVPPFLKAQMGFTEDTAYYAVSPLILAYLEGLIDVDEQGEYKVPKALKKQMHPQYDDYMVAFNKFRDYAKRVAMQYAADADADFDNTYVVDSLEPDLLTLQGFNNFMKIPTETKERRNDRGILIAHDNAFMDAFKRAVEAQQDYKEDWEPINSVNELDALPEKIKTKRLRKEAVRRLNKKDPSEEEIVAELQKMVNEEHEPFGITEQVQKMLPKGWRVLNSKQELLDTGKQLRHCYGDTETYGTTHHDNYVAACRPKNKLLITDGKRTAEIDVDYEDPVDDEANYVDEEGNEVINNAPKIRGFNVGQVMKYNNKPDEGRHDLKHPVYKINKELHKNFLGKTSKDLSDSTTKNIIGAIREKKYY